MENKIKLEMEIINNDSLEDDVRNFIQLLGDYSRLEENDIKTAYEMSERALQQFARWTYIKAAVKKQLGRGEKAYLKERLDDICKIIYEIYTFSRMIWKQAKEDFRNNREGF